MGKTTLRIYDEETMRVLRRAKDLMNTGVTVAQAFAQAHGEIEQEGQRNN
jgi:hypothetical protein